MERRPESPLNYLKNNANETNGTDLLCDGVFITSNPRSFTGVLGWCRYTAVISLHHKLNVILAVWTSKMKVRLASTWFILTGYIIVLGIFVLPSGGHCCPPQPTLTNKRLYCQLMIQILQCGDTWLQTFPPQKKGGEMHEIGYLLSSPW